MILRDGLKERDAEIERLRAALEDANQMCRSAFQIARRQGNKTDWLTFSRQLDRSLKDQHRLLHYESDDRLAELGYKPNAAAIRAEHRNATIEECARVAEYYKTGKNDHTCKQIAAAIRALKDKP